MDSSRNSIRKKSNTLGTDQSLPLELVTQQQSSFTIDSNENIITSPVAVDPVLCTAEIYMNVSRSLQPFGENTKSLELSSKECKMNARLSIR